MGEEEPREGEEAGGPLNMVADNLQSAGLGDMAEEIRARAERGRMSAEEETARREKAAQGLALQWLGEAETVLSGQENKRVLFERSFPAGPGAFYDLAKTDPIEYRAIELIAISVGVNPDKRKEFTERVRTAGSFRVPTQLPNTILYCETEVTNPEDPALKDYVFRMGVQGKVK